MPWPNTADKPAAKIWNHGSFVGIWRTANFTNPQSLLRESIVAWTFVSSELRIRVENTRNS